MGEKRQDKLAGERVIVWNVGPLRMMKHELVRRQENMIVRVCYGNVNRASTTTPVRPMESSGCVTGHITVQVDQLDSGQTAGARRNVKPAKLVFSRAKTHWR